MGRPVWPEEDVTAALGEDYVHIRRRVLQCNAAVAATLPALSALLALTLPLLLLTFANRM